MVNKLDAYNPDSRIDNVLSSEAQAIALDRLSRIFESHITQESILDFVPHFKRIFANTVSIKLRKIIAIGLIISTFSIASAQEDIFPAGGTVSVDGLRVRETPDTNGEILDHLNTGDQIDVLSLDPSGIWALVSTDEDPDPEGYVYKMYLNQSRSDVIDLEGNIVLSATLCGVTDGYANDSGEILCAAQLENTVILYAHNYTPSGQVLLDLYLSEPGTEVGEVIVGGVNYGQYVVVRSYTSTGNIIENLLSEEAKSAVNNVYITLVTTNPELEYVDPSARRITLIQRVEAPQ